MPARRRSSRFGILGTGAGRGLVVTLATVVACLLVVAVAGGFGKAPPAAVDRVDAAEAVDVGPATIAVTGWTVRSDIETSALEDVDGAVGWLVVAADTTATTRATTTFPDRALSLPDDVAGFVIGPDEPPRVVLLRDGRPSPDLQPGLRAELALLWPVTAEPDAVEVDVTYIRSKLDDSTIDASRIWRVDRPIAVATIPRDDDIAADLIEDEDSW